MRFKWLCKDLLTRSCWLVLFALLPSFPLGWLWYSNFPLGWLWYLLLIAVIYILYIICIYFNPIADVHCVSSFNAVHVNFIWSIYLYIIILIYVYLYTPGTCLSSILGLQPSKTRFFPIKTGVICVPGLYCFWCSTIFRSPQSLFTSLPLYIMTGTCYLPNRSNERHIVPGSEPEMTWTSWKGRKGHERLNGQNWTC